VPAFRAPVRYNSRFRVEYRPLPGGDEPR
jgi:hypothetical protein